MDKIWKNLQRVLTLIVCQIKHLVITGDISFIDLVKQIQMKDINPSLSEFNHHSRNKIGFNFLICVFSFFIFPRLKKATSIVKTGLLRVNLNIYITCTYNIDKAR